MLYTIHLTSANRLGLIIGAAGLEADDIAPHNQCLGWRWWNRVRFQILARETPFTIPQGDAGIGIDLRPSDRLKLSAGYVASPANDSKLRKRII